MATLRHYVPTMAELIDRLSILLLKRVYISENAEAYDQEMELIIQDINLMIHDHMKFSLSGREVRAILLVMLANRIIWENEYHARLANDPSQTHLRYTHSINGIRNRAKNVISQGFGERVDLKVDCLAADLPKEFGNWDLPWL